MADNTDWGSVYDKWAAGQAGSPYSQLPSDPAAAAARRAQFISNQSDPQYQAAATQRNQETNAYQTARDGALGMMNPGSIGANGTDYGKAQADPSAALNQFLGSGYTGQQALQDGWGKGVGAPGWQSTPQSQHLNPNGGNMAAMAPGSPGWGQQAGAQQGGQDIYQQLGAQLGPQGSTGGGMPPGYQQPRPPAPQGGQSGNPYAALAGPMPSSVQGAPQQGGNPFGALSSYLDQRSQGGYGGPSHQPAQLNYAGTPQMVPASSLKVNPGVLSSLAQHLGPTLYNTGSPPVAQRGSLQANPHVLSSLAGQLGPVGMNTPGTSPKMQLGSLSMKPGVLSALGSQLAAPTGPVTESRFGQGHF